MTTIKVVQRSIEIGSPFLPLSVSTAQLNIPDSRMFELGSAVYYLGPRGIILNNRLSIMRREWVIAFAHAYFSHVGFASNLSRYLVRFRTATGSIIAVVSEGVVAPVTTVVLEIKHSDRSLISICHSQTHRVIGISVDYLPVANVNVVAQTGEIVYE